MSEWTCVSFVRASARLDIAKTWRKGKQQVKNRIGGEAAAEKASSRGLSLVSLCLHALFIYLITRRATVPKATTKCLRPTLKEV